MANPAVVVDFVANTKDLQSGFRQASGAAGGFGTKLKGFAKAGIAGAAAAGVTGLTLAIKTGIAEYKDAAKVSAQTNAVLKSTGKVAGVSAAGVESLAGSLMKKSGVDDEAIQSGENLLLTFTNIRNEAGKGNRIFDQATKATLDLSVALGKDMASSATLVGKALNDPAKGLTALTRVGVTFTDAQKEQIKALTASGKSLEAQKIILGELNKEFGGSAEAVGKTLPGQINVVKQSFNNLTGQIVAAVIPALSTMIMWLRDHWPQISAALSAAWATMSPMLVALGNLALGVANLIKNNWNTIGPIVMGVANIFRAAVNVMVALVKLVTAVLRGDWSAAWKQAGNLVHAVVAFIVADVQGLVAVVIAVLRAGWATVKAVTNAAWEGVESAVRGSISAVKSALNGLKDWLSGFAHGALATALGAVSNVFDKIDTAARGAVSGVKSAINDMITWLSGIVDNVGHQAGRIASALKSPINTVIDGINAVKIPAVHIGFAGIKVGKKRIGKIDTTIGPFDPFGDIPKLARGGIVNQPTIAMIGEAGPEAVIPLNGQGNAPVQVRVFIGDQELTHLIRTEIVDANTGIARAILAG